MSDLAMSLKNKKSTAGVGIHPGNKYSNESSAGLANLIKPLISGRTP